MDAINNYVAKNVYLSLGVTFVVGLILGLVVLGWLVFPVEWTDASPGDLTASSQQEYVQLVADSYALNQNVELARSRLESLGADSTTAVQDALATTQGADNLRISNMAAAVGSLPAAGGETGGGQEEGGGTSLISQALGLIPLVCGVAIVVALIGGAAFFLISRRGKETGTMTLRPRAEATPAETPTMVPPSRVEPGREPPIAQFMTTYVAGDDLYDDSFSIDSPSGDFLGECGVGISETIGVGDPKKVAALEVWLFDKNDIRTVTKVVMSEHTFGDDAVRSKLSAKGEPALAKAGDTLVLETATLRVTARVVDLAYGGGPLPPNSYFERITIELAAWQKEGQAAA
jgi:hypothetical protein